MGDPESVHYPATNREEGIIDLRVAVVIITTTTTTAEEVDRHLRIITMILRQEGAANGAIIP
jgi:hypothetical protein